MFTGKYRFLRLLAFTISCVSAYASFWFGYGSINTDIVLAVGVGLALVALCFAWAQLPAYFLEHALAKRWGVCIATALAIAIALPADTISTLSSVNAAKGMERHRAMLEKTAYTDQRTTITRSQDEIKHWQKYLEDIKQKASWAGTRTPESFDGEIEAAKLAVQLEAGRGGCKTICEAKKVALGNLIAQRGMAEAYADYQAKIEATKQLIDKAKARSAEINPAPAVADLGNQSVAQMFRLTAAPDERSVELAWFGSGWVLGLAFVLFPALLLLSVRWIELIEAGAVSNPFKKAGAHDDAPAPIAAAATSVQTVAPAPLAALANHHMTAPQPLIVREVVKEPSQYDDSDMWKALAALGYVRKEATA